MNRREWLTSAAGALTGAPALRASVSRPNIVMIMADDLGYTALNCYGGRFTRTPNLDRLAADGVRFTDAYATPQCTPTRACLLTGQQTPRHRMWHVIPPYHYPYARVQEPDYADNLPRGTPTVAAALRAAGYTTGIVGKWHVTANSNDGFYEQLWPEAAPYFGFDWAAPRNEPQGVHQRGDKGVELFTSQAIEFMRMNRGRPFFLYLSHHTIHNPVLAPDELEKTYRERGYQPDGMYSTRYMAAVEHLDRSVGRLLQSLEEMNLAGNTMVVFFSDNGGIDVQFDNAPLRAGKGSPYEGGIRVPAIVRWPGRASPGLVCDVPVHVCDWYPTFLEAAGAEVPAGHILDGESAVARLRAGSPPRKQPLYWYMPLYDPQWGAVPAAVIRDGGWKLIEFFGDYIDPERGFEYTTGRRLELYDLLRDVGERQDLSKRDTRRTTEMNKRLRAWMARLNAPVPGLNPGYDPARPLTRGPRGGATR